jgi:hypothetical protein
MLFRLLSLLIVGLWLGSLTWLAVEQLAPPESRMTEIDPREVYEVFFAWNDTANLTLLEQGRRRGQLAIAGGSGTSPESSEIDRVLSLSGVVETYDPGAATTKVEMFFRGLLELAEDYSMKKGEAAVRLPERQINATLTLEGRPLQYRLTSTLHGADWLSFQGGGNSEKVGTALPPALLPLTGMLGLDSIDPATFTWTQQARFGEFSLQGRRMPAYRLSLKADDFDSELRIYFSQVGEPLWIDTDFAYEAISEVLVPLEAYQRTAPTAPES